MTDRELLERAAKAAGMADARWSKLDDGICHNFTRDSDGENYSFWNPLTDDGDALRLAVRLRLEVVPVEGGGVDVIRWVNGQESLHVCESGKDEYAATRRAIVRAAAEMAK